MTRRAIGPPSAAAIALRAPLDSSDLSLPFKPRRTYA